jgi:acetyl esterase/lipase
MANPFHPELRRAARWLPRFSFGPRLTRLVQWLQRRRGVPAPPERDDLTIRDVFTAAPDGHRLRIRTFIPSADRSRGAGMVWIHGGGFIIGSPEQDQDGLIALCRDLGLTIAAVSYRLAPAHPHPTPVEDCYAALRWLHDNAAELGIDPTRIAIGGNSAGGGLAAGLVLLAHDRGEWPVAFQLLIYPMLDDRTALRTDTDERRLRLWSAKSNRYAWGAYLGRPPGGDGVSDHAAPARRENLSGLPPAWIGVGTCDLFHDEDLEYARRLQEAGVPCELHVVEGGFHGFDLVKEASVSQTFRQSYTAALRRGLGIA